MTRARVIAFLICSAISGLILIQAFIDPEFHAAVFDPMFFALVLTGYIGIELLCQWLFPEGEK